MKRKNHEKQVPLKWKNIALAEAMEEKVEVHIGIIDVNGEVTNRTNPKESDIKRFRDVESLNRCITTVSRKIGPSQEKHMMESFA